MNINNLFAGLFCCGSALELFSSGYNVVNMLDPDANVGHWQTAVFHQRQKPFVGEYRIFLSFIFTGFFSDTFGWL